MRSPLRPCDFAFTFYFAISSSWPTRQFPLRCEEFNRLECKRREESRLEFDRFEFRRDGVSGKNLGQRRDRTEDWQVDVGFNCGPPNGQPIVLIVLAISAQVREAPAETVPDQ